MNPRTRILILMAFLLGGIGLMLTLPTQVISKKVYISQTTRHSALDATTKGIIDGLQEKGFEAGKNLETKIECAQGNVGLAAQIATLFASKTPEVCVAVGTLSAQSLAPYARQGKFSLVFSTVTDPVGAKLVTTLDTSETMTTGVSNFVALEPQLDLFKKIVPNLKRLGILYNPGEPNSASIVSKLEYFCAQEGITLVKQTLSKTSDAPANARQLASNAQALFISNDNTALSSLNSILKATQEAKIPLFVSDTDAVSQGATAALGPNQYDIGVQTGHMIARILLGEKAGDIAVAFPEKTELFLNEKAAHQAGITLPSELIKQATRIIR